MLGNSTDGGALKVLNAIESNMQKKTHRPLAEFLQDEFCAKKRTNPKYSVRAFARDLDVSSAYLSQLLNGKRKLSFEKALQISKKLHHSPEEQKSFLTNVRLNLAKTKYAKELIGQELIQNIKPLLFYRLPESSLKSLTSWITLAVLESMNLKDFQPTVKNIASRFGITKRKAEESLQLLSALGVVDQNSDGAFKRIKEAIKWPSIPSKTIRKIHSQFLDLAKLAIENQNFTERNISGSVFSISKENYPQYEKLINEFREKTLELSQKESDPTAVYRLSVQFFRLDKGKK